MSTRLQLLEEQLRTVFGERIEAVNRALGELTVIVPPRALCDVMLELRDHPQLRFSQLVDLCGVDYSEYAASRASARRFAVVYHLLSIEHNCRLRVRAYCEDDDFPVVNSVVGLWPGANWFEREAFDLFGIVFTGHPDLRRLLTDYGFVGHPFRKDFPLSGNVEMRYDPDQQRVIYQPVTIEPREIVPRVVREESYGDVD
ncbi:MAG: NADH-quinone oxidoreductase subunit C [Burkholderiales bacterium]|jgi:NADH-quinone oxidoreductase subunit C